jgi:hypothetical protein
VLGLFTSGSPTAPTPAYAKINHARMCQVYGLQNSMETDTSTTVLALSLSDGLQGWILTEQGAFEWYSYHADQVAYKISLVHSLHSSSMVHMAENDTKKEKFMIIAVVEGENAVYDDEHIVAILSPQSMKLLHQIELAGEVVALEAKGNILVAATPSKVYLYDLRNYGPLGCYSHAGCVSSLALSSTDPTPPTPHLPLALGAQWLAFPAPHHPGEGISRHVPTAKEPGQSSLATLGQVSHSMLQTVTQSAGGLFSWWTPTAGAGDNAPTATATATATASSAAASSAAASMVHGGDLLRDATSPLGIASPETCSSDEGGGDVSTPLSEGGSVGLAATTPHSGGRIVQLIDATLTCESSEESSPITSSPPTFALHTTQHPLSLQCRVEQAPIAFLAFDPSGTLLLTASTSGCRVNVFRILPPTRRHAADMCYGHSPSSPLPSAPPQWEHCYSLIRGTRPARIAAIALSPTSRQLVVLSSRGTQHTYTLTWPPAHWSHACSSMASSSSSSSSSSASVASISQYCQLVTPDSSVPGTTGRDETSPLNGDLHCHDTMLWCCIGNEGMLSMYPMKDDIEMSARKNQNKNKNKNNAGGSVSWDIRRPLPTERAPGHRYATVPPLYPHNRSASASGNASASASGRIGMGKIKSQSRGHGTMSQASRYSAEVEFRTHAKLPLPLRDMNHQFQWVPTAADALKSLNTLPQQYASASEGNGDGDGDASTLQASGHLHLPIDDKVRLALTTRECIQLREQQMEKLKMVIAHRTADMHQASQQLQALKGKVEAENAKLINMQRALSDEQTKNVEMEEAVAKQHAELEGMRALQVQWEGLQEQRQAEMGALTLELQATRAQFDDERAHLQQLLQQEQAKLQTEVSRRTELEEQIATMQEEMQAIQLLQQQQQNAVQSVQLAQSEAAASSSSEEAASEDQGPADDESDAHACAVCLDNPRSVAFLPCGHVVVCEKCAEDLEARHSDCIVCRTAIERHLRVYLN